MKKPADSHTPVFTPPGEEEIASFRATVYGAAWAHHRTLPWRETTDPYRIMVSEVMLQQTQAERVVPKFIQFIGQFPDVAALASAELPDVLLAWQGLGYNRRAVALKRAAEAIVLLFDGIMPATRKELETLPGIGTYTAGAILAFAHDLPVTFIETNIRSVHIHHFFHDRSGVHDRDLLPLVETTLDRDRPRAWYNALMDYGVLLKRNLPNPSRRSVHHTRQPPFEGSNRQLRSALLRAILAHSGLTASEATALVGGDPDRVAGNLVQLEKEGLIVCRMGEYVVE